MTRRHFHQIRFEDGKLYPPLALKHPDHHEQRRIIRAVGQNLYRFASLWWLLDAAFREAKVNIRGPEIRELIIYLKDHPNPAPELWLKGEVRAIMVDIGYDTSLLADIPLDNRLLGEMFISWIEEALAKLTGYPQIPFDLIRSVLAAYRAADYTYAYKIGERTIPGTRLKGRLDGTMNCVEHVSTLTVSYRGKELFRRETYRTDELWLQTFKHFSRLSINGSTLQVQSPSVHAPDTLIDLSEYPEVMELLHKAPGSS